ncbi:hypothetical protein HD601_004797 [Jiangella mangrovi]|uniref:Uncharacterized protein n=1 Tax=Jiangella mangrovi TaxID=1524084 RepID=A0A7W9GUK4_9ACTN|nr:hypothetical protein [Jiangella mangrovi]
MAAIPVGVALIGLGIALWRDPRPAGGAADAVAARPDTLGVR